MADELNRRDANAYPTHIIVDADTDEIFNAKGEVDIGANRVVMYSWDVDSLTWIRFTGNTLEDELDDLTDSVNKIYYPDTRFAYVGATTDAEYVGKNTTADASVDAVDWHISKFTYTSGNVTRKQVAQGAWSNRGSMF